MKDKIEIDGVTYTRQKRKDEVTRAVIVIDRGWIAAGDVTEENGRIRLDRAVWVFRWESIGFDGMIANPKDEKVKIKPLPNGFDIPSDSEIFRVPVDADWGL